MFKTVNPTVIPNTILSRDRRVLLFGPPGVGKSTLTAQLARSLCAAGRECYCISADPGSPAFGVPGAVSLAQWRDDHWHVIAMEGLCTLDAGRFRLPVLMAVQRLVDTLSGGMLFIDGPGVVRGVAGRELLSGLVSATGVDVILAVTASDRSPPLLEELKALNCEVVLVPAAQEARRPGKNVRAKTRTMQWDAYLADAVEKQINLAQINLTGTPPPTDEPDAWIGRQIAFMSGSDTRAMGEVQQLKGDLLSARVPADTHDDIKRCDTVAVRDALRTTEGMVETATPFITGRLDYIPAPDQSVSIEESGGPRITGRVGPVDVTLMNGVFGDPLLHLRLRHRRRSLLFDLGEGGRLPARLAHQVSDVFISHAHFDHIGGFPWLLRSRIGDFPVCRLYGPPGLAKHVAGFLQGILWDRVAEFAPCFEVTEIFADHGRRFRLQAGIDEAESVGQVSLTGGILLDEQGFKIRAAVLDHYHIPVVAYAFEPAKQINIRKDRLLARGLEPGHWLTELKQHLLMENNDAVISLPDGNQATASELVDELVLVTPGRNLVYATDLADIPDNRERLTALARNAHTFFCEAPFLEKDIERARRTGHLTTRACGEIATAAGVGRLVPFHFSRRYSQDPQLLYEEIQNVCNRLVMPPSMTMFAVERSGEAISIEE
jgi:ribonuclease Z